MKTLKAKETSSFTRGERLQSSTLKALVPSEKTPYYRVSSAEERCAELKVFNSVDGWMDALSTKGAKRAAARREAPGKKVVDVLSADVQLLRAFRGELFTTECLPIAIKSIREALTPMSREHLENLVVELLAGGLLTERENARSRLLLDARRRRALKVSQARRRTAGKRKKTVATREVIEVIQRLWAKKIRAKGWYIAGKVPHGERTAFAKDCFKRRLGQKKGEEYPFASYEPMRKHLRIIEAEALADLSD